jgi:hypothetical protein
MMTTVVVTSVTVAVTKSETVVPAVAARDPLPMKQEQALLILEAGTVARTDCSTEGVLATSLLTGATVGAGGAGVGVQSAGKKSGQSRSKKT